MHILLALLLLLLAGVVFASDHLQIPLRDKISSPAPENFDIYESDASPYHSIRIKRQNSTLCDTPADQYTGWLDIGHKHIFFWYFAPERDDASGENALTLWLAGGPGVPSLVSMLQELGPCLINEYGNGTVYNPHGWNKNTALLFVDQPAGVGFSYVDDGEQVPGDSFTSASDMYAFLKLFTSQAFPKHKDAPLIITGESYAGHYIPLLGAEIIRQNSLQSGHSQIRLKSIAMGNALVSPLDTAYGYYETLCTTNPGVKEPVFNETRCDIIASNLSRCMAVVQTCYDHPDIAVCQAAYAVCRDGVLKWYDDEAGFVGGRSRFDITTSCEMDNFCYHESALIGRYLNLNTTFAALGVPPSIKEFELYSQAVSEAFDLTSDFEMSLMPQVQYLLANQVDVLIYQGNLDLAGNTAAAKRWSARMPWKGQPAFTSQDLKPWKSIVNGEEKVVGTFKEVWIRMIEGDEKRTRFSLVTINGAGHFAPQDQPEVALNMLNIWLTGKLFA